MTTIWRSEDIDADAIRWAVSPEGLTVLHAVVADDTGDTLAVAAALRAQGLSGIRAATVQSIATASRAAWAAGHAGGTWWTPAAREQASDPQVAAWRARRYRGQDTVDVTAGCGGDALVLAGEASTLVACDADPARLSLLRANLPDGVPVVRADATRPAVVPAHWAAWADPGRRVDGRRIRRLAETRPAVPALAGVGHRGLGIAISPGVDLEDPARPTDAELEFVQVGRHLREATLWLGPLRETSPGGLAATSATMLPEGHHRRGTPSGPPAEVTAIGAWLAEPAPALVRARLADEVADELDLVRVARHRALYTSDSEVTSAWFRSEQVEAVVAARPAAVRDALRALDDQPLEVLTHGISVDVDGWWRALGSPTRGPAGRAIHLVRLDQRSRAVVTRRTRS